MLNKEKYMDELMKYACKSPTKSGFAVLKTGGLADCYDTKCDKCEFCDDKCEEKRMKWLEQEYEPSVDWTKVPVDTQILVRDYENHEWIRRYFARYVNGEVLAWRNGTTSWSTNHENVISWKYAKLAESEG